MFRVFMAFAGLAIAILLNITLDQVSAMFPEPNSVFNSMLSGDSLVETPANSQPSNNTLIAVVIGGSFAAIGLCFGKDLLETKDR